MSGVITEAAQLIQERLREIHSEKAQLEKALADLQGLSGRGRGARRGPQRRRTNRRNGTRRGQRQQQFLDLVARQPGVGPKGVAEALGITTNHAYTLAATLDEKGLIERSSDGYRLRPGALSPTAST